MKARVFYGVWELTTSPGALIVAELPPRGMQIIEPGATRKNVFKEVARLRRADADVLRKNARWLGAIYLLGYSIECHLKFAVCERNAWDRLPELIRLRGGTNYVRLYVHDWTVLVRVAGIGPILIHSPEIEAIYSARSEDWGPKLRYRTAAFRPREGEALYSDLAELYQFLTELIP